MGQQRSAAPTAQRSVARVTIEQAPDTSAPTGAETMTAACPVPGLVWSTSNRLTPSEVRSASDGGAFRRLRRSAEHSVLRRLKSESEDDEDELADEGSEHGSDNEGSEHGSDNDAEAAGKTTFNVDQLAQLRKMFADAFADLAFEHPIHQIESNLDSIVAIQKFVGMHEQGASPYTTRAGHTFFNLAQSIVGASETYSVLRDVLTHARRSGFTQGDLIGFLLTRSYSEFNNAFRARAKALGLVKTVKTGDSGISTGSTDESSGSAADDDSAAPADPIFELHRQLWTTIQIWNLESARRLSGGVLNAINARMAHRSAHPDVTKVFVNENVMSQEGASGKSADFSKGKFERYKKELVILNRLLGSVQDDPALAAVKAEIVAFLQATEKDQDYSDARTAWHECAEMRKNKLPRGISAALIDNDNVNALLDDERFSQLRATFTSFMRHHYTGNPRPAETKDAPQPPVRDTFLLWLINKAASSGHESALTELFESEAEPIEPSESDESSDASSAWDPEPGARDTDYPSEAGGFTSIFENNERPLEATAWRHVSNLRHAYRQLHDLELLHNLRIHASRHSQHVDLFFAKYEDSVPMLADVLSLFPNRAEGLRTVQYIVRARDKHEFDRRLEPVRTRLEELRGYYQTTRARLTAEAKSERQTITASMQQLQPGRGSAKGFSADELLNPNQEARMRFLALDDLVITSHPDPGDIDKALGVLRGLWRVYAMIEVTRDPGAGGINLLTLAEGTAPGGEPLELEDIFLRLNLMSPQGIAEQPELMAAQIAALAKSVVFTGKCSAAIARLLPVTQSDDEDAAAQARDDIHQVLFDFLLDALHSDEPIAESDEEPPDFAGGWGETTTGTIQSLREGFEIGEAVGDEGNNCLIDTLRQLASGGENPPDIEPDVDDLRAELVKAHLLGYGEMIDFYGPAGQALLNHFTETYRFQVTVHQVQPNGTVLVHPHRGEQGPMLHILHRGWHFQPMRPRDASAAPAATSSSSPSPSPCTGVSPPPMKGPPPQKPAPASGSLLVSSVVPPASPNPQEKKRKFE